MPVPGKKLKDHIADALDGHAYTRWPQLEEITTTWRGSYGYLTAWLTATESIRLCRIQYLGDPDDWGFALYHASTQTYIDGRLPQRCLHRHTGTSPRHRPRPLPQRPHSLANRPPEGLTRCCASYVFRYVFHTIPFNV
jgi:hypothetical protein